MQMIFCGKWLHATEVIVAFNLAQYFKGSFFTEFWVDKREIINSRLADKLLWRQALLLAPWTGQ